MLTWFKAKLITPLFDFLKQGTSPQKLAWSIAIGLAVGISPTLGLTTLLCLVIALAFRLNLAAMQLVNYAAYPLQLLLIVPFFQAGLLFSSERGTVFSLDILISSFESDFLFAFYQFGWSILHAIFIWLIVAIPFSLVIYVLCLSIFNKFVKEKSKVI